MSNLYQTDLDMSPEEDAAQRAVAESPQWLLAVKLDTIRGRKVYGNQPSEYELRELGFTINGKQDLFYLVIQPQGWTKVTHGYFTRVFDELGRERIYQFYKGAPHDTRAFLQIK
jgi:hypothetical protein